jgi:hypothetical protein
VLALQPHLIPRGGVFSLSSSESRRQHTQTYCYQAVRTAAIPDSDSDGEDKVNCFTVNTTDGTFTRVFSSSHGHGANDESDLEIRPGYVLPGLWDGHGHLIQYGEFLHSADLFGAGSPGEVRRRLREYLAENPGVGGRESWVRGIGWDQMLLGGMPTAVGIPFSSGKVCVEGGYSGFADFA